MGLEDNRKFKRYSSQSACEIRIDTQVFKGSVVDYSDGLGVIAEKTPLLRRDAVAYITILNSNTEMKAQVAWVKEMGKDVRVGFKRIGNLKGNLKDFELADVIIGIQRGTKTGTLEIVSKSIVKRVYIKNGDMHFADSSYENDHLGEMLVLEGKITIDQFNLATERQHRTGEKLGKILVDMSCLTPKELYQAVRHQIEEIILSLFTLSEGAFDFKEGSLPDEDLITLIISAANIIYRGMKRIQSFIYVKQRCPSPETVLVLSRDPMDIFQSISLDHADKQILYLINGRYNLKEILALSSQSNFETLKSISAFLKIGTITINKKDEAPSMVSVSDVLKGQVNEDPDEFLTKVEELHAQCESADYYNFFGIDSKATEEEIQKAYYKISKQFHPDRHFIFPKHDIKGKLINIFTYATEANTILSDPEKRYIYEEELRLKAQNISNEEETGHTSDQNAGAPEDRLHISGDNDMDSFISDFQEDGEQILQEDPESHYELGHAYMEMGLEENAITEFRIASNAPSKKIECCKAIAGYYLDKGEYHHAIAELKKLVSELSADHEGYVEIKYDLADSYIKNNEYENALNVYSEIQSQDAGYRDVAEKVEAIKSIVG